ncbi:hypothetical protein LTR97_004511 [Elasticomyces elasticus]|uniref:Uncharacterized protein n=1 Tax=Elasticomyces elasticus TaxID=574655 RepID=A0AAN8A2B6_9PEZI|nr:hypothetical protein LTR97_004511 [Elasticomyces elasticus]
MGTSIDTSQTAIYNCEGDISSTRYAYVALVHLDFFFLLGFWLQYLMTIPGDAGSFRHTRGITAVIGDCLTPLQLILGLTSARNESRIGQCLAALLDLLSISLLAMQISWITGEAESVRKVMSRIMAYGAIATPLLLVTAVLAVKCMFNFDKGVKPILKRGQILPSATTSGDGGKRSRFGSKRGVETQLEPLHPRMDLD